MQSILRYIVTGSVQPILEILERRPILVNAHVNFMTPLCLAVSPFRKRKRLSPLGQYKVAFLYEQVIEGTPKMISFLIDHGADVDHRMENGGTAYQYAAHCDRSEIMKLLLRRGADPSTITDQGSTALMAAAEGGSINAIKYLFSLGADVNETDARGETALLRAVAYEPLPEVKKVAVCRALLVRGASARMANHDGLSPFVLARAQKLAKVLQLFRSYEVRHGARAAPIWTNQAFLCSQRSLSCLVGKPLLSEDRRGR